jgi:adenylate kinase
MQKTIDLVHNMTQVLNEFKKQLMIFELNHNHEEISMVDQALKEIVLNHADELYNLEMSIKNNIADYEKHLISMTKDIEQVIDSIKTKQGF